MYAALSDVTEFIEDGDLDSLAELDTQIGITGTPSSSTYWRGDNTWAAASGSETNSLETIITGIADDEIPIGSAADDSVYTVIPDCNAVGSALAYEDSTNTISCRSGFSSGSTVAYDDVDDPDANSTIDFTTYSVNWDTGISGDSTFFGIQNTAGVNWTMDVEGKLNADTLAVNLGFLRCDNSNIRGNSDWC